MKHKTITLKTWEYVEDLIPKKELFTVSKIKNLSENRLSRDSIKIAFKYMVKRGWLEVKYSNNSIKLYKWCSK
ncbi:MAG: hypothetical protein ABIC91_07625 [Nanoarchaeota archaeon]